MFTGIVEEVGRIITADRKGNSARLKIEAEKVLEDIKIGDKWFRRISNRIVMLMML